MSEFRMPSLGADMTEGVLLEWLVHTGDVVHKGDIVAVVDTSKAAVEVECFESGTVDRLLVDEGTRVPIGTPLATIRPDGAEAAPGPISAAGVASAAAGGPPRTAAPAGHFVTSPLVRHLAEEYHLNPGEVAGTGPGGRITRTDIEQAAHPRPATAPARPPAATAGRAARPARVRISPLARRIAAELGVEVSALTGTGADGAITVDDVRRATAAPRVVPAPDAVSGDRAGAMRATIAAAMSRAKREIPHYYLTHTIDLYAAMRWLRDQNLARPVTARLVPAALLLKAAARGAVAVPEVNGWFTDGEYRPSAAVHLGVAVSLRGGGLVAPAIHDAAALTLDVLMARMRDLVTRTRTGRLRGSELSDGTITVSSLGDQGVDSILGVIYPPQVALVGFGAVTERPCAVDGLLGIRPIVVASLAGDHRVSDGATGARYLRTVDQLLQRPEEL